ncbi:hypothetical protein EZS27_002456 [termite gut metagenome]|uniref:Uncharacterized protein n=1 Tax=termite gut metagenome TaxID=433724 RepID=A0A5J4SY98_9ZZZZ
MLNYDGNFFKVTDRDKLTIVINLETAGIIITILPAVLF